MLSLWDIRYEYQRQAQYNSKQWKHTTEYNILISCDSYNLRCSKNTTLAVIVLAF